MSLVAPLAQVPPAQLFFHPSPIKLADDCGFSRINTDLRRAAMPFGSIALPITMKRPRHELPTSRFL